MKVSPANFTPEQYLNYLFASNWYINNTVGHFQVVLCLCFKTSPSAKPFIWKWVSFAIQWTCEQNWFSNERFRTWTCLKQRQRELGNGLLNEFCCVVAIVCKGEKRYFDLFTCAESRNLLGTVGSGTCVCLWLYGTFPSNILFQMKLPQRQAQLTYYFLIGYSLNQL